MLRPSTLRPVLRASGRASLRSRRTLFSNAARNPDRLTSELDINKLNAKRRDYEANRTAFLAAGAIAGIISFVYTGWKLKNAYAAREEKAKRSNAIQSDTGDSVPIPTEIFKTEAGEKRKVVVHDEQGREIVPTGNSVVQAFPRTLDVLLPTSGKSDSGPIASSITDNNGTEFTLVDLGTRTVTFVGIQVYVVGFYVATPDIEKLQHYLVKKINPLATTLIPSEKDSLRKSLKDPSEGEETWNEILKGSGCRSLFRITPVRDTDFHHLRDGFIRAITARSQRDQTYSDDAFGAAIQEFKGIFNRGTVPKRKEMLLCRDSNGSLSVLYGNEGVDAKKEVLGTVNDERISRLLWLNYLAGKKVAAEKARENIIEGVMEFVERPVGTVATQVV